MRRDVKGTQGVSGGRRGTEGALARLLPFLPSDDIPYS